MQYMLLKDVSRQTHRWKILVRIARLWEFRDQQTNSILYEVDFVAIDRQGGMMEGYIPSNRIDQFKDQLKEGSVYTIEQFVLSDAKKTYKSVEHPYRIRFTQRTKMLEILAIPENFPLYAYNAKPFSVLATRMNDNAILSDVVGLITSVTDISTAPSTQQYKRQVHITNGSERAVVTLWGNHAEAFDAEDIRKQSNSRPMIILFVGMTVSQFSGMLAFKSTSVTKWYINIPTAEVIALRETTKDQSYQVEEQGSSKQKGDPIEITLTALESSAPYDRIGDQFRINVQLTELVTKDNWWYLSCKSCWKKMQSEGTTYKCPRCSSLKGEPRYKAVYMGVDINATESNNPTAGQFTFLGQNGVSLIGKDEALLVADPLLPQFNTPNCLFDPIGKNYVLTVELTDNSLDSDNLCFQVSACEEIRRNVEAQEHTANIVDDVPVVTPTGHIASDILSSTLDTSEKMIAHTPLEDTTGTAIEKTKSYYASKKRETSPPSRSGSKKGRGSKSSAAKQLSFPDDQSSDKPPSTKTGDAN